MRVRIISGSLKGRFINVPNSDKVRPTTDRVKETLFNILNNRIDFEGIKVLDLYAGSGSLGLECFSRGASAVHFIENNPAVYRNLQQNIELLKAAGSCRIFKMESVKYALIPAAAYDLIIADPPYMKNDIYKVVENIRSSGALAPEGIFIIERSVKTKNEDTEVFGTEPFKIMGDTCLFEVSV